MTSSKKVIHFSNETIYICLNEFKLEDCSFLKTIDAKTIIVNLLRIPKVVCEFIEAFVPLFTNGTKIILITDKESLTQCLIEKYGVNKHFHVYHTIEDAMKNESID